MTGFRLRPTLRASMVIDVHAHLYPRAFMEELAAHGPRFGVSLTAEEPPCLRFEGIAFWRYTAAFHDPAIRLGQMDAAGVERQVLSLGPPMVYWAEPGLGLRLCRIFNDEIAKLCRAYPDRFVGFAAVPLQDCDQALGELDRAAEDLGLRGVAVGSNIHGTQLDHSSLGPFWERVALRRLPVFIHPINPPAHGDIHDYRLDLVLGFPFDTTTAAVRLAYSGILERHPLAICLAHLGGTLPFLWERIKIGWEVGARHFGASFRARRPPHETLSRLYLDTVSYHDPAILAAVACVGAERLLLGSDAPFAVGDLARSVQSVRHLAFLSEAERARILGPNAERFLAGEP